MKELNKKEIAELLGKSYNTITKWSTDRLSRELKKNCWEVVEIKKVGRERIFVLEYKEHEMNIDDFIEGEFNVRNSKKFLAHTDLRVKSIKDNIPMSPETISKNIGVSKNASVTWDKKLESKGVISKNDNEYLYYFKYPTGEVIQVEEGSYRNYCCVNYIVLAEKQDLYSRYDKGGISRRYLEVSIDALNDKLKDGIKAYKLSKYELNEGNVCYQVIKKYLGL